MTAAGRLWRRAPLWRLSLGGALTFAALTALYPPAGLRDALSTLTTPTPPPDAATGISVPDLAPARTTLTPFAGRQFPLPSGDWHEIIAGRFDPQSSGHQAEIDEIVLARLQHGRLTGLIDVSGTTGPSDAVLGLPRACLDPTNYADHASPGDDQCWLVRTVAADPSSSGQRRSLLDGARDRLVRLGVAVPAMMTRAAWFHTAGGEFMNVQIDLPSVRPDRLDAWMKPWATLLDRGFDDALRPAQITPRLARDPDAP